jgi:hypothetical protein
MGLLNVQEAARRVVSTYCMATASFVLARDRPESRQAFVATRQGVSIRRCYNGAPLNPHT